MPESNKKGSGFVGVISFIIGFVIVYLISNNLKSCNSESLEDISKQEFIHQQAGSMGLSIESPIKLKEDDTILNSLPDEAQEFYTTIESYIAESDEILIMANSFNPAPGEEYNMQDGADGSIYMMRNQEKVSNFRFTEKNTTIQEREAIHQTGSFNEGKKKYKFHNLIINNLKYIYQVTIIYNSEGQFGDDIIKRILESIKIK